MSQYKIVDRRGPILIIEHPEYGQQMWCECHITYKHDKDACAICGSMVGRYGYRPVTNKGNRMIRICRHH